MTKQRNVGGLVQLKRFENTSFVRGRHSWVEALWMIAQFLLLSSWIPGSWHRCVLLRFFGARVGRGVVIKPRVSVKFPWKLVIGNHAWIGERVWIDNLDAVEIGSNVCISQDAYLCTGSHDWSRQTFNLIVKPIRIENGAWIAACSSVGPGVTVGEGAVLTLGSVAVSDLEPWMVYQGNPAQAIRSREIRESD